MKPNYKQDPFFQVPRTSKKTALGDVELPIYFLDASNVIAIFRADKKGVASLLEGTGLNGALSLAGKPLVFISLYEYRDSSVGAYNEVGVAIPVLPEGMKKPISNTLDIFGSTDGAKIGWHIVNLPVTTERANAAGREIWGYPKFVAQIPLKLNKSYFTSQVKDPENVSIMKLSGKLNLGIKAPTLSGITYSHLNNKLLRSTVNARGEYKAYLAHQLRLTIGNSAHNMAENLKVLGLENARPISVLACQNFQSRLSDVVAV
jgi:hypothetical protein